MCPGDETTGRLDNRRRIDAAVVFGRFAIVRKSGGPVRSGAKGWSGETMWHPVQAVNAMARPVCALLWDRNFWASARNVTHAKKATHSNADLHMMSPESASQSSERAAAAFVVPHGTRSPSIWPAQ